MAAVLTVVPGSVDRHRVSVGLVPVVRGKIVQSMHIFKLGLEVRQGK